MVSAADQRIHGSDRQTGTASGMPPAAAATAGSSSPPASGQDSSSASSSKKLSQAEQDARILASLGITQRQRKQSLYVLSCVWFASGGCCVRPAFASSAQLGLLSPWLTQKGGLR